MRGEQAGQISTNTPWHIPIRASPVPTVTKDHNLCLTLSEPRWVHLPHVSEDKEDAVLVLQESDAQSSYSQILAGGALQV